MENHCQYEDGAPIEESSQQYTADYFLMLDPELDLESAQALADRWNRTEPQTLEEVRSGRRWEEQQRLASADRTWASDLPRNDSK